MIEAILNKLGYVKKSKFIDKTEITEQLNFARSVGKRLDEHRELVEVVEEKTDLFEKYYWPLSHMKTQDDYLIRLYYIVYGEYPIDEFDRRTQPTGEYVRARPKILGECRLPEYSTNKKS